MSPKIYVLLLLFMAIFCSCSTNSTSDLIDDSPLSVVRYSENVAPVIANNCLSCHSNPPVNGAPISLTSYELVRDAVLQNGLLERISRDNGESGLMPNGGPRLPQHTIDILTQWESDGFQP